MTSGLSLTGFRLVVRPTTPRGFPCCIGLPLTNMPSPLPRRNGGVLISLASSTLPAFPVSRTGRLPHHPFRGLLSVHCSLRPAGSPSHYMTLYTEGFRCFVTSTTAPIATGRSESCQVGFAPTKRPCLCTAHREDGLGNSGYIPDSHIMIRFATNLI